MGSQRHTLHYCDIVTAVMFQIAVHIQPLSFRRMNTLHSVSACISSSNTIPICSVNSVV